MTDAKRPQDGTARLCLALYGKEIPSAYLGGSNARMLHDAANVILATRRALRLAQARAMHNLANTKAADALTGYFVPGRCFRMARLATYWAKKFERMAAECGGEMG